MCNTFSFYSLAYLSEQRSIYATEAKKTVDGTVPGNFWNTVDASLREMRNDKEKDPVRISKYVTISCLSLGFSD